jgi:thiol:disulfide interchange protein DsbD
VPGNTSIEAKLKVGDVTSLSADAAAIESWRTKVPGAMPNALISAWWNGTTNGDTRPFLIQAQLPKADNADFYPDASDNYEVQPETEFNFDEARGLITLNKAVKKFSGDWPKEISGVIVVQNGAERNGISVRLPLAEQAPVSKTGSSSGAGGNMAAPQETASAASTTGNAAPALPARPLWQMMIYAFIGGLILNIMPCVLPVIALKILGFVSESKSDPRRVRKLGLVYALGVIVSFLVLAAVVIGVKAAGHSAGWGMQFGSPIFIVCLTTLVTLVALNLFGVFEVTLGGRALNTAGELASRHGASGAFFNGVLATTLATPCTAPFLAPALGFAFAQSADIIILIFIFIGLGLASPYILLSWNPALLKFLPKPGAWMEKFKIAMGFPMLATVMWLFYIASSSYGKDVAWLGGFLVVVGLAAWIFGEFVQRGRRHQIAAGIIALLVLAGGYFLILEKELDWRGPLTQMNTAGLQDNSPDAIHWQPWSQDAIAQAQAAGKPVIVDFTADWCLTCQVNKKTSIEIPSVRKKLKDLNAVALVGDYTRFPEGITEELQRFGRAGVPLVLVYPKEPNTNPVPLPEVLTPSIVLAALDHAAE